MEAPRIVAVECPSCGERVDIVFDVDAAASMIGERQCGEGHHFWVQVGPEGVRVLTERPE